MRALGVSPSHTCRKSKSDKMGKILLTEPLGYGMVVVLQRKKIERRYVLWQRDTERL